MIPALRTYFNANFTPDKYQAFLRRIEIWVEEKNETMVFVTNNLKLAASTIAAIYKER